MFMCVGGEYFQWVNVSWLPMKIEDWEEAKSTRRVVIQIGTDDDCILYLGDKEPEIVGEATNNVAH